MQNINNMNIPTPPPPSSSCAEHVSSDPMTPRRRRPHKTTSPCRTRRCQAHFYSPVSTNNKTTISDEEN
eukprot:scaffold13293_cov120-Cylindrotheca_fusiformis.AAC.13